MGPGKTVTLAGTITPGQNPTSVSYSASCDLTAIGGSATSPLSVTDTTFSLTLAVSANTAPGTYNLPCSVTDDQFRSATFNISATVLIDLDATCGAPATPIHLVQGAAAVSPLLGQVVDLEGIVVGAFQGSASLNGFYLEEPPATDDGDPLTSEGIFVFSNSPAVNPGDRVRIRGTVAEFSSATGTIISNLTELGATSNASLQHGERAARASGRGAARQSVVGLRTIRRHAGQFTQQLVVTGTFNLGTFARLTWRRPFCFSPRKRSAAACRGRPASTSTPAASSRWTIGARRRTPI